MIIFDEVRSPFLLVLNPLILISRFRDFGRGTLQDVYFNNPGQNELKSHYDLSLEVPI